jgi:thiol-disulfide isomerase/thioredoxin
MSGLRNVGLAALFALAFLAWGISSLRPLFRSISGNSVASNPAPAWELKDLDGKLVKSSDFLGKVVILDFWATWCAPCKAEIPGFIALQKQYGDQGLVVIGVSLDNQEPAVVRRFMADFGMNYRVVLGDLSFCKLLVERRSQLP